jgi:hypothetical protein
MVLADATQGSHVDFLGASWAKTLLVAVLG